MQFLVWAMTAQLRINRTALENIRAYHTRTHTPLPREFANAIPSDTRSPRLAHKSQINSVKPKAVTLPKAPDRNSESFFVPIGGKPYGLNLCRLVYDAHCAGVPDESIAFTYHLDKNTIHAIVQKGRWRRLGKW